jgi:ubiquitin carboxyl-terminal hydrolase 8
LIQVNIGIESYHRNSSTLSNGDDKHDPELARQRSGKVGLTNMGNTCFMNSSLQCLSNTIPLTDYFLGYDYKSEINHDNFLGTGGVLSTAYCELVKNLWLGDSPHYKPREFKSKLEQFAPQFQGYDQQDAQELIAFLLDGIHEDLNRVKKRPYIEEKDCDGTNDNGDSMVAWSNYLLRNRSIIVDMFQGQLRNTMTCRNKEKVTADGTHGCGHCNVKFDPFMYLSLPISSECNTLDDCLQLFCEEELLEGDEMWYCPKCESHVEATKKVRECQPFVSCLYI